uniref:Strawberry notch-like protein 2 n=1 Tax=Molossus molossus TaxID=27622 RepID=A0A7J8ICZ0_MOLMO|nr:strawberry notch-like protein 2 [Molossus molossus]
MLALGPAMDGEFPQHETPPAGSILYSPPPLQSPLCGSSVQSAVLHYPWWNTFPPTPYPAFSTESHQFVNFVGPPFADTSYSPAAATPSFLPKSDFPQVGDPSSSSPSNPQWPSAAVPAQGIPATSQVGQRQQPLLSHMPHGNVAYFGD